MKDFKFKIGDTEFTVQDLGDSLNQEFVNLHKHFLIKEPFNHAEFDQVAHSYFDSHVGDWAAHDAFFGNFTIIWRWLLELGHSVAAEGVWEFALGSASTWEKAHRSCRLHKGTPYYFWGMTVLLRGDLDRGFLLMHQALDEDIRSSGTPSPDTPASAFATLDYSKQDQALRNEVQDAARFLDQLLNDYRQALGQTLTLSEFRDRLFNTADLREPLFLLVFALFKMKTVLTRVKPVLRTNEFAGLLETGVLFNLCLVIDSVIGYKNRRSRKLIDHLAYLSSTCQFNLSRERLIQLSSAWGQDFRDFPNIANALLHGAFSFEDGLRPCPAEIDIALAYGLRNLGAHRVQGLQVIYENFEDVSHRTVSVLFLAVEHLYR